MTALVQNVIRITDYSCEKTGPFPEEHADFSDDVT